jgi:2-C-methyl-D-erythritol 4-phosphate cytidylyltransferase
VSWAVVPAAGRGSRLGAQVPKQYLELAGQHLLAHALDRLLAHPRISGVMVVLASGDPHWPGWRERLGKPVLTALGGGERADSVLAGLLALPASVAEEDFVLVHDAARPCLVSADIDRLFERAGRHPVGGLLAAPVRDTLKRADAADQVLTTEPRESLWRALTPQMFRRGGLQRALAAAAAAGVPVTDEAMAMERLGLKPLLVEGREDNIKVTTRADLALAAFILSGAGDSHD